MGQELTDQGRRKRFFGRDAEPPSPAKRSARKQSVNDRDAFFASATAYTPLLAVETEHGVFVLSTEDGNVGRSLFINQTRGEFNVLRSGIAALERAGCADRARQGVFVDVGANIGTSVVAAVRSFGFAGGIALEPEPNNHMLLRFNVAGNGLGKSVTTLKVAASNRSGAALLRLSPGKSGGHELQGPKGRRREGRESIKVKVVTLDTLVDRNLAAADGSGLIWIDAQGEEGHVLAGAGQLTKAGTPVILELAPRHLASHRGIDLLLAAAEESYTHVADLRSNSRPKPIGTLADLIGGAADGNAITDVLLLRNPDHV